MAKKIDTSNLTVDYKQLMRMTVQDRVGLANSGLGEELMQSLTPTDRKSTRLNSSHIPLSRMPSSA